MYPRASNPHTGSKPASEVNLGKRQGAQGDAALTRAETVVEMEGKGE
jgi:hypothetical protein